MPEPQFISFSLLALAAIAIIVVAWMMADSGGDE